MIKFKLYIFMSLIIHLAFLIIPLEFKNKERLKGEKLVPIEIINNKLFNYSKGNSNQNSLNKQRSEVADKNNELIKTEKKFKIDKELNSNKKKELYKGDLKINQKQIDKKENKKPLLNEKKLKNTKISTFKKKGVANKVDKKDLEKGSVKGQGKLKVACLNCVSPKYPSKALKKGLEGNPTVKLWILTNGNVEKAEIINSSGINSIDAAALEAAKNSKFYPIEYKTPFYIQYDLNIDYLYY